MWPDVIAIRDFYTTTLGKVARRMIYQRIRTLWPTVKGKKVLALGYSTPYLKYYRKESPHLIALMAAEQGALAWSKKQPNIAVLTEETLLPLADQSIDLALVIHGLEFTAYPHEMMRELWRVLKEGGRLLLVVPNRTGLWARRDKTPFGQGHIYSLRQIISFMQETCFTPLQESHALFVPPTTSKIFLSTAHIWEEIGRRWFPTFSGVLIVEVSKQVYACETIEAVPVDNKIRFIKKLAVS